MKNFSCIITEKNGIHARPAGLLVKEASRFKSRISIFKGENTADAKGLFSLMGLGIKSGDMIEVKIEGEDEEDALKMLKEFLHSKFCGGGGVADDGVKG